MTKKISIVLTVLLTLSLSAHAQTVGSANVMGYTKKTVPANGLIMVSNPFINSNKADMSINEIFGTSLPDGTELYVYDNGYTIYSYIEGLGWFDDSFGDAGDIVIPRGQGLWIKNVGDSSLNILLSGNIPGKEFQSATNSIPDTLAMVSSSYPAMKSLVTLGLNPVDGDEIYVYDSGYTIYSYIDGMGWFDDAFGAADDVEIDVGSGFWYKTSTPQVWVQNKPYSDF